MSSSAPRAVVPGPPLVLGPVPPTALQRLWPGPGRHAPARALAGAVGVGTVAAAALPGHRPGLGVSVLAVAVAAAAVPDLRRAGRWVDLAGVGLATALVAVVTVRDAEWVAFLACLAAAVVGAVALTGARSWAGLALTGPAVGVGAGRAAAWAARGATGVVGSGSRVWPLVRSGAVAALLLTVFGLLLASADVVFASLLPDVEVPTLPTRAVALLAGAAVALVVTYLAASAPRWQALTLPGVRPVRRLEWLVPVVALDGLVVTFVGVQVTALLGGHRHVLETAGLSYAEYARQGFGQLVVVTLLVLAVVAVAARLAPRATHADRVATSAALAVLVVSTLGVVVSALRRMDLYVEAFGLTRLRLVATAGEVGLGVVLLLVLLAGVRWRGAWLPRAVVATAATTVLCLAALNPDALVAERNIERWRAGAELDVSHLSSLSADATPALSALPGPLRSCVLADVDRADPGPGWGSWNLGRARAAGVLQEQPPGAPGEGCGTVAARPR